MFLQHLTVSEAHLCSPPIQPDKPVMGSLVSVLQLRVLGLSGVTQSHVSDSAVTGAPGRRQCGPSIPGTASCNIKEGWAVRGQHECVSREFSCASCSWMLLFMRSGGGGVMKTQSKQADSSA